MNPETNALHFKTNKLWTLLLIVGGLIVISFSPFAFNALSPKLVLIAFGCFALLQAVVSSRATIILSGTLLTSSYWQTKSIDLAELTAIKSGNIGGSAGDGITLVDKQGRHVVLIPRLYRKQDMIILLNQLEPYFPKPTSSLPWVVRARLKGYGVK